MTEEKKERKSYISECMRHDFECTIVITPELARREFEFIKTLPYGTVIFEIRTCGSTPQMIFERMEDARIIVIDRRICRCESYDQLPTLLWVSGHLFRNGYAVLTPPLERDIQKLLNYYWEYGDIPSEVSLVDLQMPSFF